MHKPTAWVILTAIIFSMISACDTSDKPPVQTGLGAEPKADKVFVNGNIITVDDENPKATAVAVRGGLITYVGNAAGLH